MQRFPLQKNLACNFMLIEPYGKKNYNKKSAFLIFQVNVNRGCTKERKVQYFCGQKDRQLSPLLQPDHCRVALDQINF